MLYENSRKADEDKKQKYNSDEIFKTKTKEKEETSLVQIKKEKWYEKIFSILKKIFKV